MKRIIVIFLYRKRFNISPPFFHACTSLKYEIHAGKKGRTPIQAFTVVFNFQI